MLNLLRTGILLAGVTLLTAACQSTGGSYSLDTQTTAPVKSAYENEKEYLARFAAFAIPRSCGTYIAYDGDHSDKKHSKSARGSFFIRSIIQNGHEDYTNWYAVRAAINQVDGKFYFNSENQRELTCGYLNFEKTYLKSGQVKWANQKIIMSAEDVQKIIDPAVK